ncbi:rhomboid family intramembrane serine protease [Lutimonas halocynthiae]|uniref:rhomboid family intramembrane serine protease n=1 Tax=Lutimonas halocynthiae TaxID=1446477 RepID=UPI0025B437F2|nr:rhomboid family intramembrane serine protease [Lutimonas halocynthiae]MDN3644265.1 rhomboid family intramembrane serine protease [Lutimonas halocynthiae]
MGKLTDAIKHLIILNVIFFAATSFIGPSLSNWFALYFPENENFGFWQFVTHMFMHGGFMHILFNMYALWAFGSPLEQMWGRNKFLFFYFSAGIGAGLIYTAVNYFQFNSVYNELISAGMQASDIQTLLETRSYNSRILDVIPEKKLAEIYQIYNTPAVGASGAIYGVLVAFGMSFPNAKLALIFLPVPIAAKYFIPVLIGLDLFSGVTGFSIFGGGIAHFAHVGGAIIGFIMMKYWQKNQFSRWN